MNSERMSARACTSIDSCASRWLAQLLVGLVVVLILALIGAALAQPQIEVELGVGRLDRTIVKATITNPDGSPVNRRMVEFYMLADFFPNAGQRLNGVRPVYLGSHTTNTAGVADTFFDPPYTGDAVLEAHLIGDDGRTEAVGRIETPIVRTSNPVNEEVSIPLQSVRLPLGFGILGLMVFVWAFLLALALYTIFRIKRLGKEALAPSEARTGT